MEDLSSITSPHLGALLVKVESDVVDLLEARLGDQVSEAQLQLALSLCVVDEVHKHLDKEEVVKALTLIVATRELEKTVE